MAKLMVKQAEPTNKQKQGQPANSASKQAKNWAHTILRNN